MPGNGDTLGRTDLRVRGGKDERFGIPRASLCVDSGPNADAIWWRPRQKTSLLGLGVAVLSQLVLLKLVAELAKAEPEELGGTGLHPLGSIEGFRQDPRLDLVERGVQVHPFLREVEVDPPGLALAADRLRQGVNAEDLPRSEHDGALHDVLQFPDVPRPVVLLQQRQRLRRHAAHLLAELLAVLLEEVRDQQWDVLPALAERREMDGDHVQPGEEVLPEGGGA